MTGFLEIKRAKNLTEDPELKALVEMLMSEERLSRANWVRQLARKLSDCAALNSEQNQRIISMQKGMVMVYQELLRQAELDEEASK